MPINNYKLAILIRYYKQIKFWLY